jgi:hypothetical protein
MYLDLIYGRSLRIPDDSDTVVGLRGLSVTPEYAV